VQASDAKGGLKRSFAIIPALTRGINCTQTRHDDGGTAACGAYSNGRRISASSAIGTADAMDRFMKAFKEIFPQKSKTTAAG
jgi:hypothetical protein